MLTQLPSDVVGVIATFLPANTGYQRPLMLVNHTWFQGVVGQDGMKPKPHIRWPLCALRERNAETISLSDGAAKDLEALAEECPNVKAIKLSRCRLPNRFPNWLHLASISLSDCENLGSLQLHTNTPHLTKLNVVNEGCGRGTIPLVFLESVAKLQHLQSLQLYPASDHHLEPLRNTSLKASMSSLAVSGQVTDVGVQRLLSHNDDDSAHLSPQQPSLLTSVDLHFCMEVTDAGLSYLVKHNVHEHLTVLSVAGCSGISAEGFSSTVGRFYELTSLNVAHCNVNDAAIKQIGALQHLTSLDVSQCESLCDLQPIASLTRLSSLLASSCSGLSNESLMHIGKVTSLTSLDLSRCGGVSHRGFEHLGHLVQLKTLTVRDNAVTDGTMQVVSSLQDLTSLDVFRCTMVTDVGVAQLQKLIQLEELTCSLCELISPQGIRHLAHLPCLTILRATGCSKLTDFGAEEDDEGIVSVGFQSLRTLELGPGITNEGLKHIGNMERLSTLKFSRCPAISDEGYSHLKSLKCITSLSFQQGNNLGVHSMEAIGTLDSLNYLYLSQCKCDMNTGFSFLRGHRGLTILVLRQQEITDDTMAHIGTLQSLTSLTLVSSSRQITPEGYAHLRSLPLLSSLRLHDAFITDDGIQQLAQVSSLAFLSMWGENVKVTDAGVLTHLKKLTKLSRLHIDGISDDVMQEVLDLGHLS